jgi:phosphoribosylformylglycinamidine cyclo-ligase
MTKEIMDNDPYKLSGVDIDAGNELVDKIKKDVAASHNLNVLGNIGGFAGMYKLDQDIKNPVLVACTDGVGTKVSLAQEYKDLSGIGQDLVAMCVNDLIVCGAKPLFFLDYYASSKLDVNEASIVIKSISKACVDSGCALLGGETAEMPGHYVDNNFDLAGFSVGCVDEDKIITNTNVEAGNVLIGIESSGPHSNGFSLIRKIIGNSKATKEKKEEIAQKSLKPTILYPKLIMDLIENEKINSLSHITGGGLTENLPRSIPEDLSINIDTGSWEFPDVFKWLEKEGDISKADMYRIFNCGIGMAIFVDKSEVNKISQRISKMGYKNFVIGELIKRENTDSVFYL